MKSCKVTFDPDGVIVIVDRGTPLITALGKSGIPFHLPCGGKGTCGKCTIEIYPKAHDPNEVERQHLSESDIAQGIRLACQTQVNHDMLVILNHSLRVLNGKILIEGINRKFDLDPAVSKMYIELPEPSLQDQTDDLSRIERALGLSHDRTLVYDIDMLRILHSRLRVSSMQATVVMSDNRIIDIEPGNTTEKTYGIAFDIGTTTVVGTILDLSSGRERAHASRLNAQIVYGEDTISRIKYVLDHEQGRHDMAMTICGVVNDIITEASAKAGISPGELYEAVIVGNTTMTHLLLGLDPAGLSQIPFVPVTTAPVTVQAQDIGIHIHPHGTVYVMPNVAGFVGADTVGVMLACDYLKEGKTILAIDVGTNGELALKKGDSILVCSTAAGPALEGATIACGMRAAEGAIEHITFTDDTITLDVIGETTPIGICGSGIIDLCAELLTAGIIDKQGTFHNPGELKGQVPDYLVKRLIMVNNQPAFLVSEKNIQTENGRDIIFTQQDVRKVQLAKGAISTGIHLLLKEMSLTPDDLAEILLAGAFGNYIRIASAQRIGLIPALPDRHIRFVGNAASTGAKMVLLSQSVRRDAVRLSRMAQHIELASLPGFMDVLTDNMVFP